MRTVKKTISCSIALILISAISTALNPTLAVESSEPRIKYWVFFNDKPSLDRLEKQNVVRSTRDKISKRALRRRLKVRSRANLVDTHDFPVSPEYLKTLQSLSFDPIVVSNWLNAVSLFLTAGEAKQIASLTFVKTVRKVARAMRNPIQDGGEQSEPIRLTKSAYLAFRYGSSFTQNDLIRVPKVHNLGITGRGIIIGMLDTGFKIRNHEAFAHLKVLAEYDFLNNDQVTENEIGQDHPQQQDHGTYTLSVIGGFQEGQLVGTAFDASFLLAKTEDLINEVRQEEDNWVAGLEWLESLGADIVSSSLGYLDFYVPEDMDGNTAVTTIAADLAVQRGVVIINSAGNERTSDWRTIISPADGDSVIAVGAVNSSRELSSFSSIGPSADGRTKPDVVAMGSSVVAAFPSSESAPSRFGLVSGTSLSAPAITGVAALILSAHPNLTPMAVRDALRLTADRADNPDNEFGWGLVNAYDAVLFHGAAFSNQPQATVNTNGMIEISTKIASKVGIDPQKVEVIYSTSEIFDKRVKMQTGPEKNQFISTFVTPFSSNTIKFYLSSTDSNGVTALHPFNAPDSVFTFSILPVSVNPAPNTNLKSFSLAANYPNPFNPSTRIDYYLPEKSIVSLTIYNVLGQKVRILLIEKVHPAGNYSVQWDGKDELGNPVPTGVYFYRLVANDFKSIRKMLLLH